VLVFEIMCSRYSYEPELLKQSGLFNRKQIADYIGVSERTVSNMMRQRRIPVIKIGKSVRFDPSKVRKALDKYEIEAI
jgi:excisionase family DNA binding protein